MEERRLEETDPEALKSLRRGWCLGGEAFSHAQAGGGGRENHRGEQRLESAVAKGERIIARKLRRLGWRPEDLAARRQSDPEKVAIAMRLRRETTLTLKPIASRLSFWGLPRAPARACGSGKSPTRTQPTQSIHRLRAISINDRGAIEEIDKVGERGEKEN